MSVLIVSVFLETTIVLSASSGTAQMASRFSTANTVGYVEWELQTQPSTVSSVGFVTTKRPLMITNVRRVLTRTTAAFALNLFMTLEMESLHLENAATFCTHPALKNILKQISTVQCAARATAKKQKSR